ncbi:hypothetical protein PAPYR_10297 [Paratrimastix pyriformis]|uniref:Uncharacterized protein n=1 Tax=Paratrimastix pyriformis TaxID=342808 RepID=A0ABQ8UB94_9EUKA|nr:hypothetical protein PAPYR_10297 [Paratrimastix pyriformis]
MKQPALAKQLPVMVEQLIVMGIANPAAERLLRDITNLIGTTERTPTVDARTASVLVQQFLANPVILTAHPALAQWLVQPVLNATAIVHCRQLADSLIRQLASAPAMLTVDPVAKQLLWYIGALASSECRHVLLEVGTAGLLLELLTANPMMVTTHPDVARELLRAIGNMAAAPDCRPDLMRAGVVDPLARLLASHPKMATEHPDLATELILAAANLLADSPEMSTTVAAEFAKVGSLLWNWFNNIRGADDPTVALLMENLAALGSPRFQRHRGVVVLPTQPKNGQLPAPVRRPSHPERCLTDGGVVVDVVDVVVIDVVVVVVVVDDDGDVNVRC